MLVLAVAMTGFGLLLLLVATVLVNSQYRSRLELQGLRRQVERVDDELRSPEEKATRLRRVEAIEARKRQIHGLFDSGGC